MYRRIFTIFDSNRNHGIGEQIYNFGIDKNGRPDNIELDIKKSLEDMNRKGLIDINKLHRMLDYDSGSMSVSNIRENIKPSIINLSDNLEFIKEKIKGDKRYC